MEWPSLRDILTVVSIVISGLAFWNTRSNSKRLNEKDAPHFDIKRTAFHRFAEFDDTPSYEHFAEGYVPMTARNTTTVFKQGNATTTYWALSQIVLWDETNNVPILGTAYMQTKADALNEAERLHIENPKFMKHMQAQLTLVNLGTLSAKNVDVAGEIHMYGDFKRRSLGTVPVVHGGKETGLAFNIYDFLSKPIPDEIKFKTWIKFDFDGKSHTNGPIEFTYKTDTGDWSMVG